MDLPKNNAVAINALLSTNVSPATREMLVKKYISNQATLPVAHTSSLDRLIELTKLLQSMLIAPKTRSSAA